MLKYRTVSGAFMFHFKTAILGGIFFGVPIILYQFWQFVAPGLYRHERRMVLPFVVSATICFVGGVAFAYYTVLPYAFDFLLDYTVTRAATGWSPTSPSRTTWALSPLLLAFGLVFEMPIITAFLAGIGVIDPPHPAAVLAVAIVLAFVIAAVLTLARLHHPGDAGGAAVHPVRAQHPYRAGADAAPRAGGRGGGRRGWRRGCRRG
ncbi:MAG: twin-arginine translocase subunit TatC [bacterium]